MRIAMRTGSRLGTLIRMCGIAAILRTDDGPIPDEWVRALSAGVAWRGPDGHGTLRIRRPGLHAVMIHHRLAIIDVQGGAQPMTSGTLEVAANGEGRGALPPPELTVTFNGCIYNHRALRAALERAGHRFHSDHSDTEVLLHGYRAWGDALVDRLEGMYAFALLDAAAGRMLVARDPFGEKPLFRSTAATETGCIDIVASDPRSVSAVMSAALRLERTRGAHDDQPLHPEFLSSAPAVMRYLLLGYSPGGETLFGPEHAPVREVPPGGLRAAAAHGDSNDTEAIHRAPLEHVEHLLMESVAARLEADRPTGCFLSGGIDSSLIACFAARVQPNLPTFCVRMSDPDLDESHFAQEVAAHIGTRHETLDIREADTAADLQHLIGVMHAPFGDSSLLAAHAVARAASSHIVVALTGDGGDELFYGYDRYRGADVLARHAWWLRRLPLRTGMIGAPSEFRVRLGRMAAAARDHDHLGALALESLFPLCMLRELVPHPVHPEALPRCLPGSRALRTADLTSYLSGDLLRKVDVAAMAAGMETRAPFLDRRLATAAAALSRSALAHHRPKAVLRDIAARHLPATVAARRKMGFGVPLARWLREPAHPLGRLAGDIFSGDHSFSAFPIDPLAARRLYEDHRSGRADHAHRLFTLLTLAIFHDSSRGAC